MIKLKNLYRALFPQYVDYLKKELSGCKSVVDLGCGESSPVSFCSIPYSVGIEIFEPYLEKSKKKGSHNKYIKADIRKIEFKPRSFNAVVALDVLEHLNKEEGLPLIKKMEKWARKKVILFTPNGYLWQNACDNNPYQEHKSSWTVEEFESLGFKVVGINGWRGLRGYKAAIKYKPTFLWDKISDLTQKITEHCPELAFQLLAVKEINQ